MHYALRWGRGLAIGLALGAIWFWLFFDSSQPLWLFSALIDADISGLEDTYRLAFFGAMALAAIYMSQVQSGLMRYSEPPLSIMIFVVPITLFAFMSGILLNGYTLLSLLSSGGFIYALKYLLHLAIFAVLPAVIVFGFTSFAYHQEKLTENPEFRRWFTFGRGGSARWAGPATFEARDISNRIRRGLSMLTDKGLRSTGLSLDAVYLGQSWTQDDVLPRDIGIQDDAHLLTIAGTGAGKSTTAVWPNLCLYEGAAIVIDPKGEHARRTIGRRQGLNYNSYKEQGESAGVETEGITRVNRQWDRTRCFLLDPFNQVPEYKAHAYNLLADIDINLADVRGLLSAISDGCIVPEGPQNSHFVESAKIVIEGLMAHVLSACPEDHRNLPYIADLLQGLDPELGLADPGKLDGLLLEMRTNDAAGGLPMMAANVLDSAGDRERGSILTTCFRSLKWATDPAMRKVLTRSDFRFDEIVSRDGNTLYIVLPTQFMKESEQIRWMRCLTNLLIAHLERRKYSALKLPLLFILDEFPQLGTLKPIEQGIVLLRSQGVKLWPILQDIGQLKALYKDNWETFIGASTIQLFGIADIQTAEWASDRLGQGFRTTTEKHGKASTKRTERYSLLGPDEVINLLGKDEPTQIVIPRNGYPMRLTRMSFRPYGRFKGLPLDGHYDAFGL